MLALVGLTLYVVGVRDARCYAAALLWVPAISGVLLSNVSIPLAFALAVLWRYRDAVWPLGCGARARGLGEAPVLADVRVDAGDSTPARRGALRRDRRWR